MYYTTSPPLNGRTFSITLKSTGTKWHPGTEDKRNLGGTTRTLDRVDGSTSIEPGLISRSGWSLVDDSRSPLLVKERSGYFKSWAYERNQTVNYVDWYFFGYGNQYRDCLRDFVKVAGNIALPPKYAFGIWWSRWWLYSDNELKELVKDFNNNGVPLDNLVIDMDWHLTAYDQMNNGVVDLAGQPLGWTGYSWNYTLFPDPESFLSWCHNTAGLHVTLNLHPAAGIQPHEYLYKEMAIAMNQNPEHAIHVPFNLVDKQFAENYFKIVIQSLEKEGIDFWWLDYQQVQTTNITNLNPTIWLNHAFFNDMERSDRSINGHSLRGLIFHRWGGLGSHRYQIGFSGDTYITWKSLDFQILFTTTAANVAFGFLSRDIGGFMAKQPTHPELYTRWVQWGALSPIFRSHAWRQEFLERRIWKYPNYYFTTMREAIYLRYSLIPYIYTEARKAHDTGIAMLLPVYYNYPNDDRSYSYYAQGLFGDSLLIAPITNYASSDNYLAAKAVFLPGDDVVWIEWHSLTSLQGGYVYQRNIAVDENPIYIKSGSVIPMLSIYTNPSNLQNTLYSPLTLSIFPGPNANNGSYSLYEDDGVSTGYKSNQFSFTTIQSSFIPSQLSYQVTVSSPNNHFPGQLTERSFIIRFVGVPLPDSVSVDNIPLAKVDRIPTSSGPFSFIEWSHSRNNALGLSEQVSGFESEGWFYDYDRFTLVIRTKSIRRSAEVLVQANWSPSFNADSFTKALELLHSGWVGKKNTPPRIHALTDHDPVVTPLLQPCLSLSNDLASLPFPSWENRLTRFDSDYKTFTNNFASIELSQDTEHNSLRRLSVEHLKMYNPAHRILV